LREATVINALLIYGGILLVASIVALLDWLARRKDQQSHAPHS
jgi:hypothetical protein